MIQSALWPAFWFLAQMKHALLSLIPHNLNHPKERINDNLSVLQNN